MTTTPTQSTAPTWPIRILPNTAEHHTVMATITPTEPRDLLGRNLNGMLAYLPLVPRRGEQPIGCIREVYGHDDAKRLVVRLHVETSTPAGRSAWRLIEQGHIAEMTLALRLEHDIQTPADVPRRLVPEVVSICNAEH